MIQYKTMVFLKWLVEFRFIGTISLILSYQASQPLFVYASPLSSKGCRTLPIPLNAKFCQDARLIALIYHYEVRCWSSKKSLYISHIWWDTSFTVKNNGFTLRWRNESTAFWKSSPIQNLLVSLMSKLCCLTPPTIWSDILHHPVFHCATFQWSIEVLEHLQRFSVTISVNYFLVELRITSRGRHYRIHPLSPVAYYTCKPTFWLHQIFLHRVHLISPWYLK
jgi:hypothetical protein